MNLPDLRYWITNLAGFAGALVLCGIIASRTHSWLTYAHLFSLPWGANILVSQIAMGGLLRPEPFTLVVLFAAWWFFLAGTLAIVRRPNNRLASAAPLNRLTALAILLLLLFLQAVAFIADLRIIHHTPITFFRDFVNNAMILRLAEQPVGGGTFSLSIWRWDYVFYVPLALLLHVRRQLSGRSLTAIYLWAVLLSVAKFTRAPLVGLAVVSFIAWIILYRPTRRTTLILGAALASLGLTVFLLTQTSLVLSAQSARWSPTESLYGYLGGSPLAYETLLKGQYPRAEGVLYSAEWFNYTLFKLSLIENYAGLSRPYPIMPLDTNLYTYLDVFTLDAGVPGALTGSFLVGALVAWSYKRMARRPSYANLTVYCYLSYCCVMAVANNEFIRINVPINIVFAGIFSWTMALGARPKRLSAGVGTL